MKRHNAEKLNQLGIAEGNIRFIILYRHKFYRGEIAVIIVVMVNDHYHRVLSGTVPDVSASRMPDTYRRPGLTDCEWLDRYRVKGSK